MKIIKYRYLSAQINYGTEEAPDIKPVFLEKTMSWSEGNEQIVRNEAYNGESTIEEDGREDLPLGQEGRIAELEEALALLLSGVTE